MTKYSSKASFSVNLNKLAGGDTITAVWIDPRTGQSVPAGRFTNRGVASFSTPDGWEDALLIFEVSGG
jgi:hypothetical protein